MRRPLASADECTQLLLRAQRGDSDAFAELYAALSPVVRDFIASLGGQLCRHERDDLVQEVFLRVWVNLATYRGEASAKTFVFGVAKKTALKVVSRRQRLPVVYTGDLSHLPDGRAPAAPTGSSTIGPDEILLRIRQAMARLSDAQRRAVELDLANNSRIAAAEADNCTPGQFADRLYQARKRLRQMLNGLLRCVLL